MPNTNAPTTRTGLYDRLADAVAAITANRVRPYATRATTPVYGGPGSPTSGQRAVPDVGQPGGYSSVAGKEFSTTAGTATGQPVANNGTAEMIHFAIRHRTRLVNVALIVGLLAMFAVVLPPAAQRTTLAKRVQLLGSVVDTIEEAVVLVDLDGNIRYFNKGAEELFRVKATEVEGHDYYWMLDDLTRDGHKAMFANRAFPENCGRAYQTKCKATRWDGSVLGTEIRVQRVHGIDGANEDGYLVRIHDLDKIMELPSPHYPATPPVTPQGLGGTHSVLRRPVMHGGRRDTNKEDSQP